MLCSSCIFARLLKRTLETFFFSFSTCVQLVCTSQIPLIAWCCHCGFLCLGIAYNVTTMCAQICLFPLLHTKAHKSEQKAQLSQETAQKMDNIGDFFEVKQPHRGAMLLFPHGGGGGGEGGCFFFREGPDQSKAQHVNSASSGKMDFLIPILYPMCLSSTDERRNMKHYPVYPFASWSVPRMLSFVTFALLSDFTGKCRLGSQIKFDSFVRLCKRFNGTGSEFAIRCDRKELDPTQWDTQRS